MKKLILGCMLTILAACSSPSTLPESATSDPSTPSAPSKPHHGEAIRTFKGTARGYEGGAASLKAYRYGEPTPGFTDDEEDIVGSGKISAKGSFEFAFNETVEVDESYGFICPETPIGAEEGVQSISVQEIYVQANSNTYSEIYGVLVFLSSDWYKRGEPQPGDKLLAWDYVLEDNEVKLRCEEVIYDVTLKSGWNTIAGEFTARGAEVMTSGMTDDFSWFFVPLETEEPSDPEPAESSTDSGGIDPEDEEDADGFDDGYDDGGYDDGESESGGGYDDGGFGEEP